MFDCCDGQLTDEDLNEEGNRFAAQYYGEEGLYLGDYADHFGDQMYVAPDSAHDFAKFSAMVEARFKSSALTDAGAAKSGKPWWKFW